MRYQRILSVCFVTLWTLCLLHCTSEKASAHWHVQTSGKAHHHHHPVNGPDEHEHGEPVGKNSSSQDIPSCCELKTTLVASKQAVRVITFSPWLSHPNRLLELLSSLVYDQPLFNPSFELDRYPINRSLRNRTQSLRVPNAPPANAGL